MSRKSIKLAISFWPCLIPGRRGSRAAAERRSLNNEVIRLLELALVRLMTTGDRESFIDAQVAAWRSLAGRWESDLSADDEIAGIYRSRTAGRDVEL